MRQRRCVRVLGRVLGADGVIGAESANVDRVLQVTGDLAAGLDVDCTEMADHRRIGYASNKPVAAGERWSVSCDFW